MLPGLISGILIHLKKIISINQIKERLETQMIDSGLRFRLLDGFVHSKSTIKQVSRYLVICNIFNLGNNLWLILMLIVEYILYNKHASGTSLE